MTILDKIVEHKRAEVAEAKKRGIQPMVAPDNALRGFKKALTEKHGVAIIAEVKKASPSKGLICHDFDPEKIALDYERGGAAAISVLTDEKFFQGSLAFLPRVRQTVSLPLLRKDFIIDHFQVDEARAWGADAILLIAAVLDEVLLKELLHHAKEEGMDCLVEVHDVAEVEKVLNVGADLIGVNNRNLKDFSVSLETTFKVRRVIPEDIPVVSESGISAPQHIKSLRNANITAALIGEALVKGDNRADRVAELVKAGLSA